MFWGLSEDLINKNNYDEVNKLLDFIFNDIETVLIKDGKEINLSQIENEKALKRIEELGEVKVVENFKAGKYFVTARKETKELGKIIKIVKFNWSNYCNDIAYYTKEIVSSHDDKQTLWILCYTNEEALKLAHLLKKAWYNNVQIALKDTWYTLDLSIEFYNFINTFKDLNEVKREDIKETYEKLRKYYWENRNIKNLWIVVKELLESYKKIYYTEIVDFFKLTFLSKAR